MKDFNFLMKNTNLESAVWNDGRTTVNRQSTDGQSQRQYSVGTMARPLPDSVSNPCRVRVLDYPQGISGLFSSLFSGISFARAWKHVAMIFAVLTLSIANVGMAWGATETLTWALTSNINCSGGTNVSGGSVTPVNGSTYKAGTWSISSSKYQSENKTHSSNSYWEDLSSCSVSGCADPTTTARLEFPITINSGYSFNLTGISLSTFEQQSGGGPVIQVYVVQGSTKTWVGGNYTKDSKPNLNTLNINLSAGTAKVVFILGVTSNQGSNRGFKFAGLTVTGTSTSSASTHTVSAVTSTGTNTYGTVSAAASSVAEGGTTTITAVPASGYRVTNWAVSGTGATISPSGASNANSTTLTMGTADATVTVTFGAIPTHSISYTNLKGADNSANPTTYTEGVGVASFANLRHLVGYDFTGWSPSSISSSATTDQTIDAQWTARAAAAGTGTLTYNFGYSDNTITTSSITRNNGALYDATNLTWTGVTIDGSESDARSGKITTTKSYDSGKYLTLTFKIADGYTFTPTEVQLKAVAVTTDKTIRFEFKDNAGTPSTKYLEQVRSNGSSVGTLTYDFDASDPVTLTGTVTVKIYAYGATDSWRLGTPLTITGTVASATPSCTAPNHVDVTGRWDRFAGETISLTATAYSSEGTGSPIAAGSITGYQWEKLVGTTWTALSNGTTDGVTTSGATTANLQIANCKATNSGKYRCVVSTGATCSTASATATDGTQGLGVKVFMLECYNDGTKTCSFTRTGDTQTGTATLTLAANTAYTFKFHVDNVYYGNNASINEDITNYVFCNSDNGGNCTSNFTINSGLGGTFTLGIDYSTGGNSNVEGEPELSVTYPRKTIYLTPGVWNSGDAKFAFYYFRDGGSSGWTDLLTNNDCGMSAEIPQWNGVKINAVRLSDDATVGTWDKKWNQTSDITVNSNNSVVITDWGSGDSPYTYGTYSIPTYTISYNAGTGGSGSKSNETKTCGVDFTLPNSAVFTRTGYTQTGWTTSDGGAQEYALGGTYTTNEDKTFYPVWTVNNYDLTWNLGGGTTTSAGTGIASGVSVNTTSSVAYGTSLTAPTVTKTGYNFSAWSPSVASTMPAANTTYTATWTVKTTAITLEAGEGGTDGSATATYGTSTITDYVAATRTGYTLGNYYKDDGDHNILTKEGTLNTGNKGSLIVDSKWASEDAAVTLYAQWSATSYTLSYDLAGGSVASPNPTSYTIESSAITLNNPTKTGYTFAGWTGTGLAEATTTVTIAAGSTGDRSYTATWTEIVPSSVSLNKSSTTITVGATETLTATISPAVVADNTITWSTSDADVATVDGGVVTGVAAGTATITATTVNGKTATCAVTVAAAVTYTVTYVYNDADGGSRPASATGASVTLPEPTKTGYTLDGWYTTAGAKVDDGGETYSPTADITLYARWTETCSGGGGGDPIVIKLFDGSTDDDFAASPITVSGVSLAYTAYDKPAEASNVSSKTNNVNSKNYAKGYQFSTSEINKGANRKCLSFTVPSGYTATFTHAFGASGNSRVIRLGSSLVTTDEDENYIATLVTVPSSGGSGGIWGGTYSSSLSAGTYFITGTGGGWQIVELIFTLTPTGSSSECNKVLYHGNGAESGYIYDPTVYDDGDDPVVLGNTTGANGVAFVKDGYEFRGWATSAGGSVAYTAGNTISDIGDDVDLYAVWAEVVPCTPVDAPTALTCSEHTSSSLTFTWTKAANASTYTAKLYSDAGCTSQVASQDLGDVDTVTFSTLSAETTYYCQVQSHGDGSTYCTAGGTTSAQSGTTDAACTAHGLAYGTAAVEKNDGDAPFTNTLTNPNSLTVTYSSSNTSAATVNATSGMVTIEGAGSTTITATWAGNATYCAGTATYTLNVSSGCTPQSLVKTQLTSTNAGTTTGYNDGQYAGDPVIASFQKTPIDGGYKMTGSAKLFVTIKGGFVADDKINIVITQASDLSYTTGKLPIFYDASSPKLLTTIDAASAGTYTYTLTASDITTLGSVKTIGVYRSSGSTENNPYVKSVEVEGCREWATCTAPDAIAVGSVTGEGATFTITDALNTNNYEIYYSTSSTAPTAETSAIVSGISTKSRAVTGLTASTIYYYWVRSNCGGATKSSWVAGTPASFTTSAAAATHSVTYNGNGASSGSVPTDATAYEEGDVVTVLGNTGSLVKAGQTFLGWSTSATASSGTFYPAGYKFYMPNAAVTLYAVWGSAAEEKYYYGSITITAGALTPGSTGTKGFFTNSGGTIATSSAISLSSTPGETDYYYESSTLTHTALNKSSNWNTSSTSKRTIRAFKFKSGSSYTLALGSKTATSIMFYGRCGSASRTMTIGGVEYESPSTKDQFFSHEYTKVGNFTGNVTITQDGDFYGILVVTVSTGAGSNHTVTFNMNGKGSAIEPIANVPSGSKIGAPVPSPTAVGAEFGGWYNEAGCSSAWNFATGTITADKTLYAKWTTCAPTIDAQPSGDTYTQGAAATALIVTASGEGLNYQWYTSEDAGADIQGSSAIPGAISASYTPSTSLLGTIYYFCVVSNTCGNAVSNKAAITVNDGRPTPTANWTIAEPKEGGKGFTFSIEVNKNNGDNWDGELLASMLTLSDNAILDGSSIIVDNTNKTISGTYGVKAGSSSPVTFYLLLPATATQSATRLDQDRTFSPCAGGAGDSYNVPVRKDYEKDASNNYRWVTLGAGEITYAVSSSISSAKAASTVASVFDYIMSNDKQYVWVKTYEANTKTIRLYVETNGANVSVNTLYKNTVYATAADKDIVSSDDYTVSYDGSGTAENTGAKGTHYMDITFDSPLAANDIICVKFSSSKVKAYGAVLTTVGDGGDQTTVLTWSNSQESGATVEKQEDAADFTITAVRDATALKSLGLISYTSSNTAIATIDGATGLVHIADNIDFGSDEYKTTTITATLAASGCYKKAVITYILKVTKHECEDAPGTITYVDRGCSGMDLTLEGYEEGATIKWYKNGTEIPSATSATYNATEPGEYYAVTHKTCDITSTNSITLEAATATAEKIVDSWYVKNGRRTPDIALVHTTGATSFTVTSGGTPVENIGGCTFKLKDDGIIYLHGQKDDGSAPSDMTPGDMTITITVSGCAGALSGLDITLLIQAETAKPSVAFVVDGTLRKDGGTATSVSTAKTSDRPLWTYLSSSYALTGCNVYWSVDSKELREYYSQFDAILITDDPNTQTNGTGGVPYVKAFGTMVDVRPILTMEAFVGRYSDGGWHVYNADPTSPNPRQVEMKLECKNHDIFKGLNPDASDNVRMTIENGNEYWHVIMVDTTVAPYHNTSKDYKALPALQGFDSHKFDHMLGVGTIAEETLQGGVERQEEPAARMMILGIQNEAMAALTNEGKLIIKNALDYLLHTNMEDVNDCANYFTDETGDHLWSTPGNWSRGEVPDFETRARILKPVVINNTTNTHVARVDIATSGKSKWIDYENCTGKVTITSTGALVVNGGVRSADAPHFGIENLKPTTPSDLAIESSSAGNGTLIFDNSDGDTQASVQMYSKAYADTENYSAAASTWQYIGVPYSDVNNALYNYYDSWLYSWSPSNGWEVVQTGGAVTPWTGYCITHPDAGHIYQMEGTLVETGEVDINVPDDAYQIIGNSWTAPIYIAAMEDDDFGDMAKTIYFFNTGSDVNGEGTITENATGSDRWAPGTYVSVPIHSSPFTGDSLISSMQGFYVANTSGSEATLHLDYEKLVRPKKSTQNVLAGEMHAPKRVRTYAERPVVAKLTVSGSRYDDKLVVLEREDFSKGNDDGWDGEKWDGSTVSPTVWSMNEEGGAEAVTATPDMDGTVIGFRAGEDDIYTFHFEYDGYDEPLYLLDTDTKIFTRVLTGNIYTFMCTDKGENNRFLLTRKNAQDAPTDNADIRDEYSKPLKFLNNDKIYIYVRGVLYDITGKVVK